MLELILLVAGVIKAMRRSTLVRLTAQDFAKVDPAKFEEWRRVQLKGTDLFLMATWGLFALKLLVRCAMQGSQGVPSEASLAGYLMFGAIWVVAIMRAGSLARKAAELAQATGIDWPKRAAAADVKMEAISRLQELWHSDQLPGIARDDHGEWEADDFPQDTTPSYPVSIVFHIMKEQEEARHSYELTKHSADVPWALTDAWVTHPDGERTALMTPAEAKAVDTSIEENGGK